MPRTYEYDAVVVGAGHAGAEAGLALARLGHRVLVVTLNLDNVALLPCNPLHLGRNVQTLQD